MGTYNIPRNVKGEGRFLIIFSMKGLAFTVVGIIIGLPFYIILKSMDLQVPGLIIAGIFALIGFIIGTFKFPQIGSLKFTRKVGGEAIDDIIKRAIMFKRKGNKLYVYTKEEKKNG